MIEAGTKGAVGLTRSKVLDLLPHGLPSIPSPEGHICYFRVVYLSLFRAVCLLSFRG